MRRYDYMGYTVEYPDAYAYAFNPMEVRITIPNNYPDNRASVVVCSLDEKVNIAVGAPVFGGVAVIDVSDVVQTMFDTQNISRLPQKVTYQSPTSIIIKLRIALEGIIFSPTVMCVWGALQTDMGVMLSGDYNDDYSGDFNVKLLKSKQQDVWFFGKPFTVSLPTMDGDTIKYSVDGGVVQRLSDIYSDGVVNVDIPKLVVDKALLIEKYLTIHLYKGITPKRTYTIKVDYEPCDKIYLRWVDKKGYYCYWAFDKVADSYQSQKQGAFIATYSRSVDYIDGFNGGDGRQQGWISQRLVGIVATLVDQATWSYLMGITQSPVVDIYTENDYLGKPRWIKAAVEPSKATRENAVLSDFSAVILLDQINNQRL